MFLYFYNDLRDSFVVSWANDLRTSFVGSPVAKQPGAPFGRSWATVSCDAFASRSKASLPPRLSFLPKFIGLLTFRPVDFASDRIIDLPQEVLGSLLHGALVSALLATGHSGGCGCMLLLLLLLVLLLLVAPPHAATATVGFVVATAVQVTALVHCG